LTWTSQKYKSRWGELENFYQLNEKKIMLVIHWWQSKTIWFNLVVFLIAFLALPEFVRLLPQSWLQFDLLGGALGNLILRTWFTNSAIATPSNPVQ